MLASDVNKIYFLSLPYSFHEYIGGAPTEESGGDVLHTVCTTHCLCDLLWGDVCSSTSVVSSLVAFSFTFILHVDRLN